MSITLISVSLITVFKVAAMGNTKHFYIGVENFLQITLLHSLIHWYLCLTWSLASQWWNTGNILYLYSFAFSIQEPQYRRANLEYIKTKVLQC